MRMTRKRFGSYLRSLRLGLGIKQADAADVLGVSASKLSLTERNKTRELVHDAAFLKGAAKLYETPLTELLIAAGHPSAADAASPKNRSRSTPTVGTSRRMTNKELAKHLKDLRQSRQILQFDAADTFDMTASMLSRLETGKTRKGLRDRAFLETAAGLYEVPVRELLAAAGLDAPARGRSPTSRKATPRPVSTAGAFSSLVLHPALRPKGITARKIKLFSPFDREVIVDLAYRIERHVLNGGEPLSEIMGGDDE